MPDSERVTEHITGIVQGITQKGADKWVVEVTPDGSQYPKRLWSKSQDAIAAVTDLIGQSATFECGVSEYEREGKMVRSLWLNAINPGTPPPNSTRPTNTPDTVHAATGSPQTASEVTGQVQTTVTHSTSHSDPTRQSIERQVSLKSAVEFCRAEGTPSTEDVDEVLAIAEDFYAYLTFNNPGRHHAPLGPDDSIPF